MDGRNSYTKIIICGILLLLLIPTFSNAENYLENIVNNNENENSEDGFWTDNFDNNENIVTNVNCEWDENGKYIRLSESIRTDQTYNFKGWREGITEHIAYSYKPPIPFLLYIPPTIQIILHGGENSVFDKYSLREGRLEAADKKYYPPEEEDPGYQSDRIHHFRFKTIDSEDISELEIRWWGKAINDSGVYMYCWHPISSDNRIGKWDLLHFKSPFIEDEDFVLEKFQLDVDYINDDGYLDVCIVANNKEGKKCLLFSDYIEIKAKTKGFPKWPNYGEVRTKNPILVENFSNWELFRWQEDLPSKTSIKYFVLDENRNLFNDSILDGNEKGFSYPEYLVSIISIPKDIKEIYLKAKLFTNDSSLTPRLYSWSVAWQRIEKLWIDNFNSTLRVDQYNEDYKNVYINKDGNVSAASLLHKWPMFGQNYENTRSSEGKGPREKITGFYWRSLIGSGTGYRNPILSEEYLYIPSKDGKKIYCFEAFNDVINPQPVAESEIPGSDNLEIVNSPTVIYSSEHQSDLIIVATGTTEDRGRVANKIYALKKVGDKLVKAWEVNTEDLDLDYICYYSSPIIYNNIIFISSWSGDESKWRISDFTSGNNKLFAINLKGDLIWYADLPAGSLCSPVIYNDKWVIIGCENRGGNSLFAFNIYSGAQKREPNWKRNVGPIGRASPIVYNDKLFVVVKRDYGLAPIFANTEVVSVSLKNNISEIWSLNLSNTRSIYEYAACSTPTVNNNVLFVASPDNMLYALNVNDGTKVNKWPTNPRILASSLVSPLLSSPAYADNAIYIATQGGYIYAIDESNGRVIESEESTHRSPIVSSPIIADGLLYYCDENGYLYCLGDYDVSEIKGTLISVPIHLPYPQKDYMWDRFDADTFTNNTGSIIFSILDEDGEKIRENIHNSQLPISISNILRNENTLILRADFSKSTSSDEAILYKWLLKIKESNTTPPPTFYENSFKKIDKPHKYTIDVSDKKTGLDINSSKYTLVCILKDETFKKSYTQIAKCSCPNGSKEREKLIANISELETNENISINKLISIEFYIENLHKENLY